MKPLHDQARQIIAEGRSPEVVPHGSAARNWQALVSRLDAQLPPGAAAVDRSLRSPLGSSALLKLTLCGVLLGGFGGGLALYYGSALTLAAASPPPVQLTAEESASPSASWPVHLPAPSTPLSPVQLTAASAPPADHASVAVRPRVRAHHPPTMAGGLAAETRLLAQAQSQLSDGAAARALALLDQHRATFPRGELVPEREAARVLALCALGRTAEAKAAQARFERAYSSSPLLARVRAGCAVK